MCRLWDNTEKCSRAGEATDYNIWGMHLLRWVPKAAKNTLSEYVILIAFLPQ